MSKLQPGGGFRCDVAVLGSGAAGLAAALTAAVEGATVIVFEKSPLLGGTTAISSGTAWMPANEQSAGGAGGAAAAKEYLETVSRGEMRPEFIRAFIEGSRKALACFEKHTPLRWMPIPYPDYHPEARGGRTEGRTLLPRYFDASLLGGAAELVRTSPYAPPPFRGTDYAAEGLKSGQWSNGYALVGALLRGCLDAGVTFVREARAQKLTMRDGRVAGVELDLGGEARTAETRRAVILASGGFEWDADLARAFLRGPLEGAPGTRANTGDGLVMAMEVGAALGNMSEAWWMQLVKIPGETLEGGEVFRMTWHERALPGSIMVNRAGRRFVNEAHNYSDIGRAFHAFDANTFDWANIPAWLLFDHEHFECYGVPSLPPGSAAPRWLTTAPTLEALAANVGIDAAGLVAAVARFNEGAAAGRDPDFHRGESAFDQFHGDQSREGTARCLRPLTIPPYHALRIYSGALGTSGGPKTDTSGRVLDVRGKAIPGLFAAGNVAASPTGRVYPGAGGTIGVALTFGHLAGLAAAKEPRTR